MNIEAQGYQFFCNFYNVKGQIKKSLECQFPALKQFSTI